MIPSFNDAALVARAAAHPAGICGVIDGPNAVYIGDTFLRVYLPDSGGAWEVTRTVGAFSPGAHYRLERGAEVLLMPRASLLDPARWRRVRAL